MANNEVKGKKNTRTGTALHKNDATMFHVHKAIEMIVFILTKNNLHVLFCTNHKMISYNNNTLLLKII